MRLAAKAKLAQGESHIDSLVKTHLLGLIHLCL